MIENIFDSHAHYDDEKFDEDRDELLTVLPTKGVAAVVNCSVDFKTAEIAHTLSQKYGYIYCAAGVHPQEINGEIKTRKEDFEDVIETFLKHEKCVAVGEIGLDYYYETTHMELQKELFERQIRLAKDLDMPIIVHDREAHEDTLNILKKYKPKGVVHCFSGSVEIANEVLKLGMYIGLGGSVTFKNAKKPLMVAAEVPENRILLETDCPYLAPVPFRGKRNSSDLITYTAQVISEIRGIDVQEFVNRTNFNAQEMFNISL